jgi:hypothetical protein
MNIPMYAEQRTAPCLRCAFEEGAAAYFFRPSNWKNQTICRARVVDEQMGILLPSDTWVDADGKPSAAKQFELKLLTPEGGKGQVDVDKTIARHKIDMMLTLLCDFLSLGHEVRGTNNLAVVKVDMFYSGVEGWLDNISEVLNRYALPRIWELNNISPDLMPQFKPDMPQRLDLDGLMLLPPPDRRGHEGPMIDLVEQITTLGGRPGPRGTVGVPSICLRHPRQGASI